MTLCLFNVLVRGMREESSRRPTIQEFMAGLEEEDLDEDEALQEFMAGLEEEEDLEGIQEFMAGLEEEEALDEGEALQDLMG